MSHSASDESAATTRQVQCHACLERVIPRQTLRTVMRHQCADVDGFSLAIKETQCPRCGERNI